MANPFSDQQKFMRACGQTVEGYNQSQFELYVRLIAEEVNELSDAIGQEDAVETLDALIDILVVTIGAVHSMGADAEGAWKEVMASNLSKINPVTGTVQKREDGKVLKPDNWMPPKLSQYVSKTS
jgi:predicted HAD superfamily Cof-like phosphohydrolase